MSRRLKDFTGKKVGLLDVICLLERRVKKANSSSWLCVCECGQVVVRYGTNLAQGNLSNCGCMSGILGSINGKEAVRHGMCGSRAYVAWQGMKRRCYDEKGKYYKNYGGRGIRVCDRWLNSFENFYEDMGDCPVGKSLNRVDNNGNYSRDNCEWATNKIQARNTSRTVFAEYNGSRMSVRDICDLVGNSSYGVVLWRVQNGFTIDEALSTSKVTSHRDTIKLDLGGVALSIKEWSNASGINEDTIRTRLYKGWSPEEAVSLPSFMGSNKYSSGRLKWKMTQE